MVASAPVAVDFDEEISQVACYVFLSSDPKKKEKKNLLHWLQDEICIDHIDLKTKQKKLENEK